MSSTVRCVQRTLRVVAILGVMLLPAAAWAQGITGTVKDTTGAVLPGVTVEAASPVLIEKVRTVVTDDQGLYRIVDLRPGTYSVTFTLTGFSTVKREGLELSGTFTATVNAELKVGALEETITVSGQTPVVDVQNVVQQRVLTTGDIETLPNAKSIQSMAALVPGLSAPGGSQDVGGTVGDQPLGVAIHGGHGGDQHVFYDGMRTNNIQGSGGGGCMSIWMNPGAVQEISMDIGNMQVESETGGFRINVIPKDGGNVFSGSAFFIGTNGSLQSDNLSDKLKARGVPAVTKVKNIFDANVALGGPIKKDKLWFFTAHRRWGNENYVAGLYFNKNPVAWIYEPDLTRQAYEQNLHRSNSIRFTWQATKKNKISFAEERQDQCICYSGLGSYGSGTASPEAANYVHSFPNSYGQLKWSNALSNKLLLDAGSSYNMMNWNSRRQPGLGDNIISVTELSRNLVYRAPTSYNGPLMRHASYSRAFFQSFTASYVTGAHAVKAGVLWLHGFGYNDQYVNGDMTYQFLNGVPRTVILRATPTHTNQRLAADLGLYVQDQWTVKRLTLNLGIRHTYFDSYLPTQFVKAGTFVPARSYPAVEHVARWDDLTPRLGTAYDLFGNGKTAVKVSIGKYLNSEATTSANARNPVSQVVGTASRSWTDSNGNYVPDCELLNPEPNGECTGPISDRLFGQTSRVSTTYDQDYLHGLGKRNNNWEGSAGVQHQVRPGVSVNATYFRRWYGNYLITDNLSVAPSDYDSYCITAPLDSRLPGGGGNQLCGLYDLNPSKVGQVNNFITFAKNYGKMSDIYDGVDLTINARLPRGALVQGGANIGREKTDMCDVVGKVDVAAATLPALTFGAPLATSLSGLSSPSTLFCKVTPPFMTDLKISGTYPLPWWNLQLSATVQSSPGPNIVATAVIPNAQIAPSLGRNLSAGANGTATVQLVEPGTLFGDRLNQVDFRVTKTVRMSRARVRGTADVYNLFNRVPVLTMNNRYGPAWQQPFITLPGRFAKFGLQVDF